LDPVPPWAHPEIQAGDLWVVLKGQRVNACDLFFFDRGLLIATLFSWFGDEAFGWRAGLIYVAIHSASSYFISGGVKLANADWRSGKALPLFLDGGVYGPLSPTSLYWRKPVAIACSWSFIVWECLAPLVFLDVAFAMFYCAIASVFHVLVFWHFGLNRFVFAWLSTYPAVVCCAVLIAADGR
jgi:hypothetical protein